MATYPRLSDSSLFQFWDHMGSFWLVAWPTCSILILVSMLCLRPMGPSPNLGLYACSIHCHCLRMKGLPWSLALPTVPRIQLPLPMSLMTSAVTGLLCLQFQMCHCTRRLVTHTAAPWRSPAHQDLYPVPPSTVLRPPLRLR